jgi:hypothetical protein
MGFSVTYKILEFPLAHFFLWQRFHVDTAQDARFNSGGRHGSSFVVDKSLSYFYGFYVCGD